MSAAEEIPKQLIQFVTRSFYDKPYVIVMDAILVHTVLSEDDLMFLVGIQRKELRTLCAKLCEDRLLTQHSQREVGPVNRPITRTYFYVNYCQCIDAVKWRMHSIVKATKDELMLDANPQGFVCPICHTRYSQIDAVANPAPDNSGFLCDLCGVVLVEDDTSLQSKAKQKRLARLMNILQPLIDLLRKVDDILIPENTFESELPKALPVSTQPVAAYQVTNNRYRRFGNQQSSTSATAQNATLNVNIFSSEDSEAQKEQEMDEKARLAKLNALPTWHVESTVGKTLLSKSEDAEGGNEEVKEESEEQETVKQSAIDQEAENALSAYYSQLAAKKKLEEEAEEQEEGEEYGDEDSDGSYEFEDVVESGKDDTERSKTDEPESEGLKPDSENTSKEQSTQRETSATPSGAGGDGDDDDEDFDDLEFEDV